MPICPSATRQSPDENRRQPATIFSGDDYVRKERPRLASVDFGETDEWAHAGRYDLYLNAAHQVDEFVRQLWNAVQSMSNYRGKTTFMLTADHGRDSGLKGWKDHGEKVEGAEGDWIAISGPDTPAVGERMGTEPVTFVSAKFQKIRLLDDAC